MSIQKGRLLDVAKSLRVTIPPIPSWYQKEYFAQIGFIPKNADKEAVSRATINANTAWQTYYIQMSALAIIEVCDRYDIETESKMGETTIHDAPVVSQ